MPRTRTPDLSHPVASSAACRTYQCGHISRSDDQAIKRALFLHIRKTRGHRFSTRGESTDTLAAYRLMQAGRSCAEVRNYADPTSATPTPAEVPDYDATSVSPQCAEVMALIAKGYSHPQIAEQTGRQTETVRSLVGRARLVTGAHDQETAAAILTEWGVIAG